MNFKFLKYFLTLSIPFLAYVSFNSTGVLTYAPILEAFFLIPVLELFFKLSIGGYNINIRSKLFFFE